MIIKLNYFPIESDAIEFKWLFIVFDIGDKKGLCGLYGTYVKIFSEIWGKISKSIKNVLKKMYTFDQIGLPFFFPSFSSKESIIKTT